MVLAYICFDRYDFSTMRKTCVREITVNVCDVTDEGRYEGAD